MARARLVMSGVGRNAAGDIAGGDNADRILAALDGYAVPFSYNAPADPVSTSSATVNTSTLAANIVAGRTLTLQAGAYGAPDFNVNDLDVICQSGVTFTGMTIQGDRFRITGGGGTAINGPLLFGGSPVDVMIDNVSLNFTADGDSPVFDGMARLCYLNCSNYCEADNWGVGIAGGNGGTDFFFIKSESEYNGATTSAAPIRLSGWTRTLVYDSRFKTNQADPRFHNAVVAAGYLVVEACQFEDAGLFVDPNNGGGEGASLTFDTGWIRNNNFYRNGETQMTDIGTQNPSGIANFTITGNRGYGAETPGSNMYTIQATGSGNTISDNLNQTYVSTPAWSGGAS
jgi:hypothetical protein